MAKAPARLSVKLDLEHAPEFDSGACIPVFHRWIRENSLDELLIDVADYRHVKNGPGILLVGLEADYGIELVDGRYGFRYTRKRNQPAALADSLLIGYRQVVNACSMLAGDKAMAEQLSAAHTSVEISFLDRLRYPNNPAAYPALLQEIVLFFVSIYNDSSVVARFVEGDPRRPLAVRLEVNPPEFEVLTRRLDALVSDQLTAMSAE